MNNVLEVDSVILSFNNRSILTDCYLRCETGDVIGILGRNGCGKSSLLKIIFGSLDSQYKNITVNHKRFIKPFEKGNLIAYLPQHDFLPKNISLKKIINIFIPGETEKNNIFKDPRLSTHFNKHIIELSGGELRYFEILLLVNLNVKFILLDEPFSKVEPLYKDVILDLIRRHQSTKGFIITDHDYTNIILASDKIILINNGACKPIKALIELEQWNYVPAGTFKE